MRSASEELQNAAIAALGSVAGLGGVHVGVPIRASFPCATVDAGLEMNWSHKSGDGREVRMAITIWDKGEQPERLRDLVRESEAALTGIAGDLGGWKLISLHFQRSRFVQEPRGLASAGPGKAWAGMLDYRARMLAP